MSVTNIFESEFDEKVIKNDKVVIVDFYAEWCGPCKMMSPIIDSIAEELGDAVKVGKVNSDDEMDLAEKFGIMSIPTIIVFKNGEVYKTFVGVTSKSDIISAVS